jgi:hypothetical protein
MTPKETAKEKARLLLAWGEGKTLQMLFRSGKWDDYTSKVVPAIYDPSFWRVKPNEPRTRWVVEESGLSSCDPLFADFWRVAGLTVTEWKEVLK